MNLDLVLTGRRVLVLGSGRGTVGVAKRYGRAGAVVTVATPPGQDPADRLYLVDYRAQPADWDTNCWVDLLATCQLVVLADVDEIIESVVRRLCDELQLLTVTEVVSTRRGRVTLVGGGPGRTDLLTVAGCRALADADVVFYDRLAPNDRLEALAPNADLVDVGKMPLYHQVSQREIESAMVARALAGDHVVRLKGGDPYVFGRGREEVQACLDVGLPVEVVPGVTSAVAVPAAAGIPVTHRGVSRMFTVVSGHVPLSEAELGHLAGLGQTIVVLMGMLGWPQLQAGLIRAGLPADTPAAIIERGFSDTQRSTIATLGQLSERIASVAISSPAVVVVGEVVRLAPTDPLAAGLWAGVADVVEPAGEA